MNLASSYLPTAYRPGIQPVSSGAVAPPLLQSTPVFTPPVKGAPSLTTPIGSTQNPVRQAPSPVGASAGNSSPFPYTVNAGNSGAVGGPGQGWGWPNGGNPTPPSAAVGAQSSQQSGGSPFFTTVPSSGQGIDPNAPGATPFGQGDQPGYLNLNLGQLVAIGIAILVLIHFVNYEG